MLHACYVSSHLSLFICVASILKLLAVVTTHFNTCNIRYKSFILQCYEGGSCLLSAFRHKLTLLLLFPALSQQLTSHPILSPFSRHFVKSVVCYCVMASNMDSYCSLTFFIMKHVVMFMHTVHTVTVQVHTFTVDT